MRIKAPWLGWVRCPRIKKFTAIEPHQFKLSSPPKLHGGIIWIWQPAGLIIASVVLPAYFSYKMMLLLRHLRLA